jgi:hypothetical protein
MTANHRIDPTIGHVFMIGVADGDPSAMRPLRPFINDTLTDDAAIREVRAALLASRSWDILLLKMPDQSLRLQITVLLMCWQGADEGKRGAILDALTSTVARLKALL